MKLPVLILLLVLTQFAWGQSGTYLGPCCDNSGKPTNSADYSMNLYSVKKHKSKTPVEIEIRSVTVVTETVAVNVNYKDVVNCETPILQISDSIGVKLALGRATENELNKFLYKLLVYKRSSDNNCWCALSTFNTYYDVYSQTMSLNQYSVGYEDTQDYLEIKEGWLKLN